MELMFDDSNNIIIDMNIKILNVNINIHVNDNIIRIIEIYLLNLVKAICSNSNVL